MTTEMITEMTTEKKEAQAHGFLLEHQLLTRIYGATDAELATLSYTNRCDCPAVFNRVTGVKLSIKAAGKDGVDMADHLRIYDEVGDPSSPLHVVVVRYKQEGSVKRIIEIIEFDLTNCRALLFGSVTRAQLEEYDRAIKAIPRGRSPTDGEKAIYKARVKEINAHMGALRIRPKCDSNCQRRVQCSLPKWTAFIAAHPDRVIAKSASATLHGGSIDATIESGPRQRKKKAV